MHKMCLGIFLCLLCFFAAFILSSWRTRRPGLDPAASGSHEFCVRQRRQGSHCAVRSKARAPRPLHQHLLFVMLQESWSIQIMVQRTIRNGATNCGTRKRSIVQVLPTHGEWREMPVVPARNAGAVSVGFLVTACAIQSRNAFAFRATHHIRNVTAPVVSLLWIVSGSMAVNAARMGQD
jgi:hypothetical protein